MTLAAWLQEVERKPCKFYYCAGTGTADRILLGDEASYVITCPCGLMFEVYEPST